MSTAETKKTTGSNLAAVSLLLLTVVLSLAWSHAKLLWNDEFLSFYSDSLPTAADVVRVQTHTPISLDPPAYHLLSHFAMDAVGRNAMALRLPALAGFLLLQGSLFVLVRRLAGVHAALLAMVLPLCTASFRYSVEGRPYGLLLGLYAASLTCWFFAAQRGDAEAADEDFRGPDAPRPSASRWALLLGLFLSIAFAITSHYFGVLVLLPVSIGEAARTWQRRRFDWPVVGTLAAGLAGVGLILPGKHALAPYQQHYYTAGVNLRNVSQGYREIFVRYNEWAVALQRAVALVLVAAVFALLWATVRRFRNRPAGEPAYLWAALAAMALLPFFGYLFGKFVTHTMEVRYVMASLIFFVVSTALIAAPALRSNRMFLLLAGGAVTLGLVVTQIQIHQEKRFSESLLASLQDVPPGFDTRSTEPIYIQTLPDDFLRTYYTSDPALRRRYVLVYDADCEVRWLHHDTNAVTAEYLRQFAPLPVARYGDVIASGSALALVAAPGGWNWLLPEIHSESGIRVIPLGSMGGMELVRLRWQNPVAQR